MRTRLTAVLAALLLLGSVVPSNAQYFGRNKVQYERFDFKVLATEHFDIYYYPEEEAAVRLAARMAERWHARLTRLLEHDLSGRQPLILYAAHPHFQQTNILGDIGEGTGGVTESNRRRVILPFAGGLAETDHVIGHELVHAFQYDIAAQNSRNGRTNGSGIESLPLWFIEGMAEYLSLGPIDSNTAMWVREASSRDAMPSIDKLDDPDFFPYRYGHAFWAYVAGRWGDRAVGDLLRAAPDGDFKAALQAVLGVDDKQLTAEWHAATKKSFAAVYETARPASSFGRPLISSEHGGGDLNVTPAVSPDGKRVVFLSEKSLFSIDMYVADVASGRITRKLVSTTTDPHFDSLQFIASAGDWAPDNRRFVFAALHSGQPVLAIVDADNGNREAEYEFKDLGEIYNPAFSPDGKKIVFSALKGGVLDLFVYTPEGGALQQLTDDPFADLDPEWTPDGREIVWVTDRFSSNIDTLSFGNYRIAAMPFNSGSQVVRPSGGQGAPRQIAGFESGRNSNPEFGPDGSLYFLGTPDGIPNVYRLANPMRGGSATRVTNVISGVSGITPLTPAMSAASNANALVFTVFENDDYNLYVADMSRPTTVGALATATGNAAVLPPANRRADTVVSLLENSSTGLPQPEEYNVSDYKSRLQLEGISQPTIGIGVDRFGAYGGGGISFMFSDLLNNHVVGATLQSTNRVEETGGQAMYLNRTSRWTWGLVAEHLPYVNGGYAQGVAVVNGQQTIVQQTERVIQLNSGASALAQYPFSRVQRLEFSAGARRIGFSSQLETQYFSPITGELLDQQREDLPHPDAINLGEATAALVYDSSVFGATSPLLGRSYRFEYSQMAGTLTYGGVLADYRRYFMPARPFTIAVRGMHYGRYGADAEDPRLQPIFIGYQGLVRGYDYGSFDASECQSIDLTSCPAFDQLVGSRVNVASAELRFPLLGLFSRKSYYGAFPIEMAFFADAGQAWTKGTKPNFAGGDRNWARSAGAALRVNVLGFAIAEIDYVRPLDRSRKGWLWQFGLTPGF
ncbi:MAG TPA: BamA/TamA family outer membrane protein [Vicinamibacterales bacterium]|nr:BamA/TamA family outer membrane protein [Vicinamibacterales bacterium]